MEYGGDLKESYCSYTFDFPAEDILPGLKRDEGFSGCWIASYIEH